MRNDAVDGAQGKANRAWNRRYSETYAGKGIPQGETYNVSMSTIQGAVKRSLKRGVAVNVAVNVDWDNPHRVASRVDRASPKNGILSMKAFNYGKLVPTVKLRFSIRTPGMLIAQ